MTGHLPDLTDRALYRHWTRDRVRFQDLDRLGHVNNVAFGVYAETGRVDFAETVWPGSTEGQEVGWTIVRFILDYRAQAYYPGEVEIGTKVLKLGNTSCTWVQGLYMGETCIGTSQAVVVWTDLAAGKGVRIPDDLRAALEAHI